MSISIITAVINNERHIENCITSVLSQTLKDIEYIVIDGGSADGTMDVVNKYRSGIAKCFSGPDEGIYDALNKGLRWATGDIVGFLHADDFFADNRVLEKIAAHMTGNNIDSCYGDLLYVHRDRTDRVIRHWKSSPYEKGLFQRGWMPPHPTFYVRREIYDKHGCFNTEFKISADYELMLRFLEKNRISTHYIPELFVKMRSGGASNRSVKAMVIKTAEDYKAWKVNNLKRRFYTIPLKSLSKIPQFFEMETRT